jgi:hypothetical protein
LTVLQSVPGVPDTLPGVPDPETNDVPGQHRLGGFCGGGKCSGCDVGGDCNPPQPMGLLLCPDGSPPPCNDRPILYTPSSTTLTPANGHASATPRGDSLEISEDTSFIVVTGPSKAKNPNFEIRPIRAPEDRVIRAKPGQWVMVFLPSRQFRGGKWVPIPPGAKQKRPPARIHLIVPQVQQSWTAAPAH